MTVIAPKRDHGGMVRWHALLMVGVCAMTVVTGCDSVQGTGKVEGGWPWRPSDMQVHELTRITRADAQGKRMVEVRVEFVDRDRDPTKAHGSLIIEISRVNEVDEPTVVELDLVDPDVSSSHYEDVTGTYLLRIHPELPGLVPGRHLWVEASYVGLDGARFKSSRELVWPE